MLISLSTKWVVAFRHFFKGVTWLIDEESAQAGHKKHYVYAIRAKKTLYVSHVSVNVVMRFVLDAKLKYTTFSGRHNYTTPRQ